MASHGLTRRQFISGGNTQPVAGYHVSSAVVRANPSRVPTLLPLISAIEGVEVVAAESGRIIVIMEAATVGELGERLGAINLLDGVIAASMVFEHFEKEEEHDDSRTDSS